MILKHKLTMEEWKNAFCYFCCRTNIGTCESKYHVLVVRTKVSCDLRCRAKYSVVRNTDIGCRAKYGVVRVVRKNSTSIPPDIVLLVLVLEN